MYTCVCTYILDARAKSMPGKSWVKAKAIGVGAAAGFYIIFNMVPCKVINALFIAFLQNRPSSDAQR